ncbi:MAG: hypothetical protein FD155_1589 [Bacteroidetes bacterium]|nr:MAG: hypothetical protein FD155_1589 [Bacteroidota bacterium]
MSGKKSLSESVIAFAAKPSQKAITPQQDDGSLFSHFLNLL